MTDDIDPGPDPRPQPPRDEKGRAAMLRIGKRLFGDDYELPEETGEKRGET